MRDAILDFIEDHRVLCIVLIVIVILVCVMFGVRSNNLKKKALEEEKAKQEQQNQMEIASQSALAQDVEEEVVPENPYHNSLGLDADKDSDGRIVVPEETEKPKVPKKPKQTKPKYGVDVLIYDHTVVPKVNVDGSSCKAYLSKVSLADFGSYWGTYLTKEDFKGGKFYMVGVSQNPLDEINEDLQSTGWLINNIKKLKDNDAIKFTNLHVIGSLSKDHVALLCSYDWYSVFGLTDTLVVFEDISGTLKPKNFSAGDIFSATAFRHNIKIMDNVAGQRVVVVQYATYKE